MISAIINNDETKTSLLLFVLQAENLKRLKDHDPVHSRIAAMQRQILRIEGRTVQPIKYPDNIEVMIAYENDWEMFLNMVHKQGIENILSYLNRGWALKPGDGDPATLIKRGGPA